MFDGLLGIREGFIIYEQQQNYESPERRTVDDHLYVIRNIRAALACGENIDALRSQAIMHEATAIGEGGIADLVYVAEVERGPDGRFMGMKESAVKESLNHLLLLDMSDTANHFQFYRAVEETTDSQRLDYDEGLIAEMKSGAVLEFDSPCPSMVDANPDHALEFQYDGKSMLRAATLSTDGKTKTLYSLAVDVPQSTWDKYYLAEYEHDLQGSALEAMRHSNSRPPVESTVQEVFEAKLHKLMNLTDDQRSREHIEKKLKVLVDYKEQARLQAIATDRATELVDYEIELAQCSEFYTSALEDDIEQFLGSAGAEYEAEKLFIEASNQNGKYLESDGLTELLYKLKMREVMTDASTEAGDEDTLRKIAYQHGSSVALRLVELSARQHQLESLNKFDEALLAKQEKAELLLANDVECGGNCAIKIGGREALTNVEQQFVSEAGMDGSTLYFTVGADEKIKCPHKGKKVWNGSKGVCTTCGATTRGGARKKDANKEDEAKKSSSEVADKETKKSERSFAGLTWEVSSQDSSEAEISKAEPHERQTQEVNEATNDNDDKKALALI